MKLNINIGSFEIEGVVTKDVNLTIEYTVDEIMAMYSSEAMDAIKGFMSNMTQYTTSGH